MCPTNQVAIIPVAKPMVLSSVGCHQKGTLLQQERRHIHSERPTAASIIVRNTMMS